MLNRLAALSPKWKLLFLLTVTFVLRGIYFLTILIRNNPDGFLVYDSYGYIQIAANLIDNGVFSQDFLPPLSPDYFRTPAYPLFLSLFRLLGTEVWVPVFIQVVITSFTTAIVYQLAKALTSDKKCSMLAALIYAIEPASICFSSFVLTESFFVLLFTTALLYLVRFLKDRKGKDVYLFALFLGISTLTRPAPVYLVFVIFPLLLFIRYTMWKTILLSILVFVLTLSPWFIRTGMTFGKPFLTKLDDEMLLFYHASSVLSEKQQIPLKEAQGKLRMQVLNEFEGDPKTEITRYAPFVRDKAMKVIRENTGIYIKQHLYGVISIAFKPVRGYFDAQMGTVKGYQSITPGEFPANQKIRQAFFAVSSAFSLTMVIFQILILLFCYLFFYHGIKKLRVDNLYAALVFLLVIFYFLNMVVPPFSEGRLRLPLMPLLIVIGTTGFFSWLDKKRSAS